MHSDAFVHYRTTDSLDVKNIVIYSLTSTPYVVWYGVALIGLQHRYHQMRFNL